MLLTLLTEIVSAVVVLAILILVHEAGHFAVAKRLGVRVLRFSIGYPPKLFGVRLGETEYAVGATPLGGYVRMLGDETGEEPGAQDTASYLKEIGLDLLRAAKLPGAWKFGPTSEKQLLELAGRVASQGLEQAADQHVAEPFGRRLGADESCFLTEINRRGSVAEAIDRLCQDHPEAIMAAFRRRAFPTQGLGKRFAIVLAGPLANLLFAPVLLTLICLYGVPQLLPIVGKVKPNTPAAAAGLKPGDRVVAVNGHELSTWDELSQAVRSSGGARLRLEIERAGAGGSPARSALFLVPTHESEATGQPAQWIIGVIPRGDMTTRRLGPIAAVTEGVGSSVKLTWVLMLGMARIVSGSTPLRQALGGPIMIAQIAGKEARQGLASIGMFTVMLSIELGIINLLPIPLLDGGHLAFYAFELVRRKPLQLRHREIALQVGLFLLAALMAFVIFNDISRIVQG
jgi:regulator of sigma E protease